MLLLRTGLEIISGGYVQRPPLPANSEIYNHTDYNKNIPEQDKILTDKPSSLAVYRDSYIDYRGGADAYGNVYGNIECGGMLQLSLSL